VTVTGLKAHIPARRSAKFVTRLLALFALVSAGSLGLPARAAFAGTSPEAATVGFYPTSVVYPQALRGGTFTERVGLIVGGTNSQTFRFTTSGPIASWLSVLPLSGPAKPLQSLVATPGDTDLLLQLKVPAQTADGNYQGTLVVEVPPTKGKNGTEAVGFGAEIKVTAQVTGTEVLSARLLDAYTYPKVEVGSPVTVFARVDNAGNVAVTPVFHLRVTRGNNVVFNDVSSPATLQPSSLQILQVAWPGGSTETAPLGFYRATLSATFGRLDLGSIAMRFKLVPYGSLHRGGQITSLKLLNRPKVGGYAELQASVLSTGEAPEQTSFMGELYRNGSLVEPVKSQLPVILQPGGRPGDTGTLTLAVPVKQGGSYRLTGIANFAGAQSAPKTLTFTVGSQAIPVAYEIAGGAAVVLLLVLLGVLFARGRRRRGPPTYHGRAHTPPRYTATHARALHVPQKTPVGTAPGRSARARRP
jgi:hypothetical protein